MAGGRCPQHAKLRRNDLLGGTGGHSTQRVRRGPRRRRDAETGRPRPARAARSTAESARACRSRPEPGRRARSGQHHRRHRAGRRREVDAHGRLGDRALPATVRRCRVGVPRARTTTTPATLWTTLLGACATPSTERRGRGRPSAGHRWRCCAAAAKSREALEAMTSHRRRARSPAFVGRLARVLREVPYPHLAAARRRPPGPRPRRPRVPEPAAALGAGSSLRIVLGARADPALHLPRLRLEGRVRDIRDGDLRFLPDEAEAMLEPPTVCGSRYTQLNRLHSLTEGWAAGLGAGGRLAADRARRRPLPHLVRRRHRRHGGVPHRGGAGRARLHDTLDFMLVTCVAERLTPELAQPPVGSGRRRRDPRQAGGRPTPWSA